MARSSDGPTIILHRRFIGVSQNISHHLHGALEIAQQPLYMVVLEAEFASQSAISIVILPAQKLLSRRFPQSRSAPSPWSLWFLSIYQTFLSNTPKQTRSFAKRIKAIDLLQASAPLLQHLSFRPSPAPLVLAAVYSRKRT